MGRKSKFSKRILVGLYPTVARALEAHSKEYGESYSQIINISLIKCLDSRFWKSDSYLI